MTAKTDFCTNAMWSTIYTGIMAAIDKLALDPEEGKVPLPPQGDKLKRIRP